MNDQRLGVFGIPGTFPTGVITDYIQQRDPSQEWTRDLVNTLYFNYKEGITDNLIPYFRSEENKPIFDPETFEVISGAHRSIVYLQKKTNLGYDRISRFLMGIENLVKAGQVDIQFLTIETPGLIPGLKIPKIFEGLKAVQGIGIVLLIGIAVYFAWPYLTAQRRGARKYFKKSRERAYG